MYALGDRDQECYVLESTRERQLMRVAMTGRLDVIDSSFCPRCRTVNEDSNSVVIGSDESVIDAKKYVLVRCH